MTSVPSTYPDLRVRMNLQIFFDLNICVQLKPHILHICNAYCLHGCTSITELPQENEWEIRASRLTTKDKPEAKSMTFTNYYLISCYPSFTLLFSRYFLFGWRWNIPYQPYYFDGRIGDFSNSGKYCNSHLDKEIDQGTVPTNER